MVGGDLNGGSNQVGRIEGAAIAWTTIVWSKPAPVAKGRAVQRPQVIGQGGIVVEDRVAKTMVKVWCLAEVRGFCAPG